MSAPYFGGASLNQFVENPVEMFIILFHDNKSIQSQFPVIPISVVVKNQMLLTVLSTTKPVLSCSFLNKKGMRQTHLKTLEHKHFDRNEVVGFCSSDRTQLGHPLTITDPQPFWIRRSIDLPEGRCRDGGVPRFCRESPAKVICRNTTNQEWRPFQCTAQCT